MRRIDPAGLLLARGLLPGLLLALLLLPFPFGLPRLPLALGRGLRAQPPRQAQHALHPGHRRALQPVQHAPGRLQRPLRRLRQPVALLHRRVVLPDPRHWLHTRPTDARRRPWGRPWRLLTS